MGCVNLGNAYFNFDKQKAKKYFGLACYLKEKQGVMFIN